MSIVSKFVQGKKALCAVAAAFMLAAFMLTGCGGSGGPAPVHEGDPDVDLTALSSTMVYSEVYNMVTEPDDYVGKYVRARGEKASIQDGANTFHAVVIADATACCAQGLEFVLDDGAYPDDGLEVTVEGIFSTYEDKGVQYCTLSHARVIS